MIKKWVVLFFVTFLFLLTVNVIFFEEVEALPGPPMYIQGSIKDYANASIVDNIPVRAYLIDPIDGNEWFNYSSGNGGYGASYSGVEFKINNTETGRTGRTIYLYVGIFNVTSITFNSGSLTRNLIIDDTPRIMADNSDPNGTTGDPFTFNVTIGEYVDSGNELTVKVNWTHGTHPDYVAVNDTMNFTGGDNINGFYFEKTVDLYCCSVQNLSYYFYVSDTSTNKTTSQTYYANVTDNDPPVTSLEIGEPLHPNGVYNNSNITSSSVIYLNATDNIGLLYIHYRLWNTTNDWSTWTVGSANTNRSFTLNEEGKNYIEYYSNDSEGNNETHYNVTLWVDGTAPTSNINAVDPYWNNTGSITLTATATDSRSGVAGVTLYYQYSPDNSSWEGWIQNTTDSSSPYSWIFIFPNGTGYYQFYSIAVDNLSNDEIYDGVDTYCGYDNASPSSNVNSIDGSYWKTSTTTINATATDSLSGVASIILRYRYSSDNGSWDDWVTFGSDITSSYSWNFTFTNGSGYYQFYSIAVDNASNIETNSVIDAYCGYDATPPTSSVDELDIGYWFGPGDTVWINATANDDCSGVASVTLYFRYSSDNVSWEGWYPSIPDTSAPYSGTFSAVNGSGYYQVYSIAVDNATNNESYDSVDQVFGADADSPVTEINTITPYWNNTGSITLTATATDALSGIESVSFYYYNSSDNTTFSNNSYLIQTDTSSPYSCTFTFYNGTGYYRFYSVSVDNVGNTESPPTTNDTMAGYDNTAPSSSINNQTFGYYSYFQNGSLTITATVNDSSETYGSGISSVCLYYWHHNATNNVTKEANTGYWNGSFLFVTTNSTPWIDTSAVSWMFTFPNGTGYYRFCSRVYDNATNAESLLAVDEVNNTECFYNNTPPNIPTRIGPNGTSVSTSANLEWNCTDPDVGDTLKYDVYFGTSLSLVSHNQTAKTYDPTLGSGTTYYWKIIAWDNHNASTASDVWSFKTQSSGGGSPGGGGSGGDLTGPTKPGNVRCTSSSDVNTPSFAWDASTDTSSDISGYYVKIDGGSETSIGDVLTWISTNIVPDGAHTFYVRAKDTSGNYGEYGSCSFTINTSGGVTKKAPVANAGGPYEGLTFENITFDGKDSTDSDGTIQNYTWDFGDGSIGYGQKPVHNYNTSGIFNVTLTVTDNDDLTDSNTTTINIILDTDGDGLSDNIEERLGSDPTNKSDVTKTPINNEVYYVVDTTGDGKPDKLYNPDTDDDNSITTIKIKDKDYYLLDTNNDGIYDTFYNPENEEYTALEQDENGKYNVDLNGDGKPDYLYDAASGGVLIYEEDQGTGIPVIYIIILLIVIIIILIIAVLFKTGYLYVAEESKEEKPATVTKEENKEEPKKSSSTSSKSKKTKKKK